MESRDDLYEKAIEVYGREMQTIVAIEEMAELQKELTKALRGAENTVAIVEEMADVYIMLEQLHLIYDIQWEAVAIALSAKADRLEERLNREKNGKL